VYTNFSFQVPSIKTNLLPAHHVPWEGGFDDGCRAKYVALDKEPGTEVRIHVPYLSHQDHSYSKTRSDPSFCVKEEEPVAGNFGHVPGIVGEGEPLTKSLLVCR
jgi:hypothetical protein